MKHKLILASLDLLCVFMLAEYARDHYANGRFARAFMDVMSSMIGLAIASYTMTEYCISSVAQKEE